MAGDLTGLEERVKHLEARVTELEIASLPELRITMLQQGLIEVDAPWVNNGITQRIITLGSLLKQTEQYLGRAIYSSLPGPDLRFKIRFVCNSKMREDTKHSWDNIYSLFASVDTLGHGLREVSLIVEDKPESGWLLRFPVPMR